MPSIERGCGASHAVRVAKPGAEYSAEMSLGTGA
jgi:hypothetical protein